MALLVGVCWLVSFDVMFVVCCVLFVDGCGDSVWFVEVVFV